MRRATIILTFITILVSPLKGLGQQPNIQEENKNVVRLHLEHLKSADRRLIVSDWAEDAQNFGKPSGRQKIIELFDDIYTTFPDYQFELVEIIAAGDMVSLRVKASGTHLGVMKKTIRELCGVQPTQKHFLVDHMHWYKIKNGKIVDHWAVRDDLEMMEQLGLVSTTADLPKQ